MNACHHLIAFIGLVIFSVGYIKIDPLRGRHAQEVEYDNAKLAIERMKDWTIWLAGLQSASISVMGFLVKSDSCVRLSENQKWSGFFAILFFGFSIVLSTWILSSLPSLQQRLVKKQDKANDIFELNIFTHINLRVGRFFGIMHTYCIIGMLFFSLFIYFTIL